MLGEFFFYLAGMILLPPCEGRLFLFLPQLAAHRACAGGGLSADNFRAFIVYTDILCEQEFIAGVIKLWKIFTFVVYLC